MFASYYLKTKVALRFIKLQLQTISHVSYKQPTYWRVYHYSTSRFVLNSCAKDTFFF